MVDELANQNLHETRWYEAEASRLAADYFDRHEGSGAPGFVANDPRFFNRNSFVTGAESLYINPRTNRPNRVINPITPVFHWNDVPISNLWGGLPGMLFSIFKF